MPHSLMLSLGLFCAAAAAPATNDSSPAPETFTSYRQAWDAAKSAHRPLLVVLNPPADSGADPVKIESLRSDESLKALLDNYVVAEIDAGAETGRRVVEVFGNPSLPRVVVIDRNQKHQLFASSDKLSTAAFKDVLDRNKAGEIVRVVQKVDLGWLPPVPGDCPNCRRNLGL